MQDYKSLCAAVMICVTLFNTQTHRQTDRHTQHHTKRLMKVAFGKENVTSRI